MFKAAKTAGLMAGIGTSAMAGGVDRSGQSILAIFETGDYAELSFGLVQPNVSGIAVAGLGGFSSGDMADDYLSVGMTIKTQLREGLDFALIVDQPFGANVVYPDGTGYFANSTTAELKTSALSGVLKYTLPSNFSILGGLRYQTLSAKASVPFVAAYTADGGADAGVGYLVGVAYEKPEIALRVALTYNSRIEHDLETLEFGALNTMTEIVTPQSVNLEFQTGIAKDTLVFGSMRWVDWTSFVIDPPAYPVASPLVSFDSDTVSYALGVGRRINETWSAALTLGFEPRVGGFSANLGPTDGYKSIGLGATYTKGPVKVTGGIRYVDIGDTQTTLSGVAAASNFKDNHAVAIGIKVGYSF
jgi:long-chain fatty acid transport protein